MQKTKELIANAIKKHYQTKTDNYLKSDPVILFNYHNAYINVCECMYKQYFKNFFETKEINARIKDLYTQIKELFYVSTKRFRN